MSFQVDILVLATKDFHIDGANLQMKTNNASKIAIFLWQLYYSQIGYIALEDISCIRCSNFRTK